MIRTGKQYIESLRDGRDVWLHGKRVEDVTTDPRFVNHVRTIARIYDMHHDQEFAQALTMPSNDGKELMSCGFMIPRSKADLLKRRNAIELLAFCFGGSMARLPDYMGTILVGLLSIKDELGHADPSFAKNIENYYRYCASKDLFLTHAFGDPQIDRSKGPESQEALRIVKEERAAVWVTGGKFVSTSAPFTNEFITYPTPRLGERQKAYVLYFSIPNATEGIKFVCRTPATESKSVFDRPLGSRFDEIDAFVIFDNVRIPKDRIFLMGDVERGYLAYKEGLAWASWHDLIRRAVKAETFLGLAYLLADHIGVLNYLNIQEKIAELAVYAEALRSFVIASEEKAAMTESGILKPSVVSTTAGRLYAISNYPSVLSAIHELSGGGLIISPSENDLRNPEVGPLLEKYFRGSRVDANQKVKLFKLAWDMTCSDFSGRQSLFEMFAFSAPFRIRLNLFEELDPTDFIKRITQILEW